jgi:hypothetical protein
LHRKGSGRQGDHECDQLQVDAVGENRRQADQRHQDQQPEVFGIPPPGQGKAGGADDGGDHQPDGRRHPAVDGGDRDDVQVRGGDAGGGQRDRTDPPTGPAA